MRTTQGRPARSAFNEHSPWRRTIDGATLASTKAPTQRSAKSSCGVPPSPPGRHVAAAIRPRVGAGRESHVPNTPTKCRPRSEPIRKSSHDCDSAEIETRSLFAIAVSCDIADRNPDGCAAAAVRCRSKSWWEGHDAMPATRSASSSHGDERANVSVSLARGGVATPSRRCPWPRKAARRISYAKKKCEPLCSHQMSLPKSHQRAHRV